MTGIKERHSREFKLKVAIEALSGQKTIAQIASEFGIHPSQIKRWKAWGLEALNERFSEQPFRKSGYAGCSSTWASRRFTQSRTQAGGIRSIPSILTC